METVGTLVDKLTIVGLRAAHLAMEANREDVTDGHRDTVAAMAKDVAELRDNLSDELEMILSEIGSGKMRAKEVRAHKIYNRAEFRRCG